MKLFVISDVHGFYDEMIIALQKAGFDKENPHHMLISCGDNFDRGNKPHETKNYLMDLPNKILITGNHEDLLWDLVYNGDNFYDKENGTLDTLMHFAGLYNSNGEYSQIDIVKAQKIVEPQISEFLNTCVNYYETQNYIFVHGWIPEYFDWRNLEYDDWFDARWTNGLKYALEKKNDTGKTLVFGHCGTYQCNKPLSSGKPNYSIFKKNNCIGIDATTFISHKVNVLVLEDELI